MALTEKQERFAQHYARHRSATQAYVWAYRPRTENLGTIVSEGKRLLNHREIAPRIEELEKAAVMAAPVTITLAEAFGVSLGRAMADPRQLMELRRKNCRCCYGEDFQRQWTEAEFCQAMDVATRDAQPMPDIGGGFGWLEFRPPNEDCPECGGVGVPWPVLPDTRHLSPDAAKLYRGYKITKAGVEILMWDQAKEWENCIRMLGGFKDNVDLAKALGDLGKAMAIATTSDPHEAQRAYREMMDAPGALTAH